MQSPIAIHTAALAPHEPDPIIVRPKRSIIARIARFVVGCWKYIVGVGFTQSLFTSLLVAGWTLRVAQRGIVRSWWKRSGTPGADFEDFARRSGVISGLGSWPNWVLAQNRLWRQAHQVQGLARVGAMFGALTSS